jgi:hypothetical protein
MTVFNLKEIEKKAYKSTFQDGIWDIFLGCQLLILAVGTLLSNIKIQEGGIMIILVTLQVLVLTAFIFAKKRLTVPRMGIVKFGPERKRRIRKSRIILLGSIIVGAVVFLAAALVIRNYPAGRPKLLLVLPAAWVVNSIIVFSFLAYYLDWSRLYLYGVFFALPVPIHMIVKELVGVNIISIAFAVPAIVMMAVGIMLLIRFLRDYPLPAGEMSIVK